MEMEIEMEMQTHSSHSLAVPQLLTVLVPSKLQSPLNSATVLSPGKLDLLFCISVHFQRPGASTVIIAFRTMTCTLLMAVAP